MKNSIFALVLMALIGADAQATMWADMTDDQRLTLRGLMHCPAIPIINPDGLCPNPVLLSDQVVKIRNRARRTLHPNEKEPAIFDEVTVYILVNATPARTAAVLSDYGHYTSYFGSVGIRGASVVAGAMPSPRVQYDLEIPIIDQVVRYTLNNNWTCHGGTYKDLWEIADAATNQDIYHVEGESEFEPVPMANGSVRTLIRYYNYLNVRNPSGREQLDSPTSRSTNVIITKNMMRQLRNAAQDAPASVVAAEAALTSSVPCR